MKKIFSISFLSFLLLFSCSNYNNSNNLNNNSNVIAISNNKTLDIKLITENIPENIIKISQDVCQKAVDKASKLRGIDYFNLPKNPFALEITKENHKSYILNYIGTSKENIDLNVEVRSFIDSNNSVSYNFNYSGKMTLSNSRKTFGTYNLEPVISSKNLGLSFELITGMPPEGITKTFERELYNITSDLKKNYRLDKDIKIGEDILVYAIKFNDELQGFFIQAYRNILSLGERKYADLQISITISNDYKILNTYSVVAFNPKTELNKDPVYKIKTFNNLKIIEVGDY
ncbi:MAG: hypothetical protein KatS3mg068_1973 [Candidatus Sericytochromatia bacterium]|nr:MAG: hypothetical protein KatS3mg068_1973 [Candidatus Sericytochromatia bacterium]